MAYEQRIDLENLLIRGIALHPSKDSGRILGCICPSFLSPILVFSDTAFDINIAIRHVQILDLFFAFLFETIDGKRSHLPAKVVISHAKLRELINEAISIGQEIFGTRRRKIERRLLDGWREEAFFVC